MVLIRIIKINFDLFLSINHFCLYEITVINFQNSTYGTCHVEYITKKVNSNLIVVKVTDEASCTNSPYKRDTNTPLFSCPSSFQVRK